jgi:hypothetical protein
MNRNIITVEAAAARNRTRVAEVQQVLQRYIREAGGWPESLPRGILGASELPIDLEKPDHWYERIWKSVPIEVLSMYWVLDKGIHATTPDRSLQQVLWLAAALLCCVAFNIMYLIRIGAVESRGQLAISSLALVAYVYINGGVFAAVGPAIVPPTAQLFVMVVTGAVLIFFKPPPPAEKAQRTAASAGRAGEGPPTTN